ncbi:DUF4440 domain-containing protein [Klenkia sp. PcliD-1-E]|uniref:nuclear transport factor 2 family protein n=1 Tax=Klenkia sp. PcliD-1-E TaxID=2954492 RepID=UPI0020981903|nr:DUF4440 domain-containing protein [Klenkia sp. PcliD-1-E]MCO7222477.1 nuclear transport factor 2 family protein [Klenkia sp. PcliD-1-E]
MTSAVDEAVRGELALLDPAVRADPARAGVLLHPAFTEVGASGRSWTRAEILEAMAGELSLAGEQVEVGDMTGEQVATDVVQLRFTTVVAGRVARRSSLWRRTDGRWQLWFHQGTLVSPTGADAPAGD